MGVEVVLVRAEIRCAQGAWGARSMSVALTSNGDEEREAGMISMVSPVPRLDRMETYLRPE